MCGRELRSNKYYLAFWLDMLHSESMIYYGRTSHVVTFSHGDRDKGYHWCSGHVIFCAIISYRSRQPLSFVIVMDGEGMLPFCCCIFLQCVCTPRSLYTATLPNKVILTIHCINSECQACKWTRTLWSHLLKATPTASHVSPQHTTQLFFFYHLYKGRRKY